MYEDFIRLMFEKDSVCSRCGKDGGIVITIKSSISVCKRCVPELISSLKDSIKLQEQSERILEIRKILLDKNGPDHIILRIFDCITLSKNGTSQTLTSRMLPGEENEDKEKSLELLVHMGILSKKKYVETDDGFLKEISDDDFDNDGNLMHDGFVLPPNRILTFYRIREINE